LFDDLLPPRQCSQAERGGVVNTAIGYPRSALGHADRRSDRRSLI